MYTLENILIGNLANNVTHLNTLSSLSKKAKKIEIVCPFISLHGIDWLFNSESREPGNITIITELSPRAFMSGVQSYEALYQLLRKGCNVRFLTKGLHAKVYRFDKNEILISSANMTESGLCNNYEIGVLLSPILINPGLVKNAASSMNSYVESLLTLIYTQSDILTIEILEKFKVYADKAKEQNKEIDKFIIENPLELPSEPYIKFNRNIANPQNISTEMLTTAMFDGFKESDWDVFEHQMEVSKENITKFRYQLNEHINPILKKFYTQLKNEPVCRESIIGAQHGYSQHVQLTTRFPTNRYLYLTKNVDGKRANNHVGIPSYIIGMGRGGLSGGSASKIAGNWLEVRTGVEEDYFTEITKFGANLIQKMIANKVEVVSRLSELGEGWYLSHGSYSEKKQERIHLVDINEEFITGKLGSYLISGKPADVQIRRLYFVEDEIDRKLLFSPKVTSMIAEDLNNLSYFFNLAHS